MNGPSKRSVKLFAVTGVILSLAGLAWFGFNVPKNPPSTTIHPPGPTEALSSPGSDATGKALEQKLKPNRVPQLSLFLQSMAETLAALGSVNDPSEKDSRLQALIASVPVPEFADVLEFLDRNAGSELNRNAMIRLIRRWSEIDPASAAAWVFNRKASPSRQEEISSIATVWAAKNPAAALTWVRSLDDDSDRQGGLLTLAYEAARKNPMDAFRIAGDLPDGAARDALINHTASQWAAQNPGKAAEWAAANVEDDSLRQQLLASIATAWADKDPEAAANMALSKLPPGENQDNAVMGIVQRWVQTQPEAAASWVTEFPPGPLRDTALEEVVKLWTDSNAGEAGEWIGNLQPEHRDIAVAAYAGKLSPGSPATAMEWAGTIGDGALRDRLLDSIALDWMASDSDAAAGWVTSSSLPEETRSRLLSFKQN